MLTENKQIFIVPVTKAIIMTVTSFITVAKVVITIILVIIELAGGPDKPQPRNPSPSFVARRCGAASHGQTSSIGPCSARGLFPSRRAFGVLRNAF